MSFRRELLEEIAFGEAHSKEESVERGKSLRAAVPRESHAHRESTAPRRASS